MSILANRYLAEYTETPLQVSILVLIDILRGVFTESELAKWSTDTERHRRRPTLGGSDAWLEDIAGFSSNMRSQSHRVSQRNYIRSHIDIRTGH